MSAKYVTLDGDFVTASTDGKLATAKAEPQIGNAMEVGDKMEDGTIFAGVSPDTGHNMFVTPKDASGVLKWKAAMKCAARLDANGHKDWRLPTQGELGVLFENRAKIGGFDETGSNPSGWYWSSAENPDNPDNAWMELFSVGNRGWGWKYGYASVRPVRSEPRP